MRRVYREQSSGFRSSVDVTMLRTRRYQRRIADTEELAVTPKDHGNLSFQNYDRLFGVGMIMSGHSCAWENSDDAGFERRASLGGTYDLPYLYSGRGAVFYRAVPMFDDWHFITSKVELLAPGLDATVCPIY